jgi:hypothetical protein
MPPFYYRFKADGALPYDAVRRADRGWLAIALHCHFLARCHGIEISLPTMERWTRMWALVFRLDDLLDESPPERRPCARRILERLLNSSDPLRDVPPEWIHEDLVPLLVLFNRSMLELDPAQRSAFVTLVLKIADLSPEKSRTQHMWSYTRLLMREGVLTAALAATCMTDEELADRRAFRRFMASFGHLTPGGVLFDHGLDLREDFEADRTSVRPRAAKQLVLLCCGCLEVSPLVLFQGLTLNVLRQHARQMECPKPHRVLTWTHPF